MTEFSVLPFQKHAWISGRPPAGAEGSKIRSFDSTRRCVSILVCYGFVLRWINSALTGGGKAQVYSGGITSVTTRKIGKQRAMACASFLSCNEIPAPTRNLYTVQYSMHIARAVNIK